MDLSALKNGSLKILYIGVNEGTSRHRLLALRRCGHNVDVVDPYIDIKELNRLGPWVSRFGFLGFESRVNNYVLSVIGGTKFDVIWVDGGRAVGRTLAQALKERCQFLVVHNLDNPFISGESLRWRLLLQALPIYDLFVTPRSSTRTVALARGARRAAVVWQAADELVHCKRNLTLDEQSRFSSEVVFVGTWMRDRGPFMKKLLDRGVPLRIFGPRWEKAPEYRALESVVTGGAQDDYSYVAAVAGAKIALCQLNFDNEDVHTTRSLEIPAIGTLLCAPHTSDHERLYRNGVEACFFETADECADLCLSLLRDDERRTTMAAAGRARALRNGRFNENVAREILSFCMSPRSDDPARDHCGLQSTLDAAEEF